MNITDVINPNKILAVALSLLLNISLIGADPKNNISQAYGRRRKHYNPFYGKLLYVEQNVY